MQCVAVGTLVCCGSLFCCVALLVQGGVNSSCHTSMLGWRGGSEKEAKGNGPLYLSRKTSGSYDMALCPHITGQNLVTY